MPKPKAPAKASKKAARPRPRKNPKNPKPVWAPRFQQAFTPGIPHPLSVGQVLSQEKVVPIFRTKDGVLLGPGAQVYSSWRPGESQYRSHERSLRCLEVQADGTAHGEVSGMRRPVSECWAASPPAFEEAEAFRK